jgi:hypothetical protein
MRVKIGVENLDSTIKSLSLIHIEKSLHKVCKDFPIKLKPFRRVSH